MKSIHKKIIIITLALLVFLPISVGAINLGGEMVKKAAGEAGYDDATNEQTFAETIGLVIRIVLSFVGVIFLALMVYAGYLWMTARGQDEQIDKATKIITSSIVGMIITVGAYSITAFVVPRILEGATGEGGPTGEVGEPGVCCEMYEPTAGGFLGGVYEYTWEDSDANCALNCQGDENEKTCLGILNYTRSGCEAKNY